METTDEGVVRAVSKDRKYFFANGSGTFGSVYQYKSGNYKRIKYLLAKDSEFMKKKENLRKKYKLDADNVEYKTNDYAKLACRLWARAR